MNQRAEKLITNQGIAILGLFISLVLFAITINKAKEAWRPISLPTPVAVSVAPVRTSLSPIDEIPHWHLFGVSTTEILPATQLPLKLNGIMQSDASIESSAIIAEKGVEAKVYHIGDKLPNGAVLTQINPEAVIINDNGRVERLQLDRPPLSSNLMSAWRKEQ